MVESGDLNAFAEPTVAFEQPGLLPLAELQLRAAQICQDTLQLDAPPRHDEDVMELGADSLALMTMLTEMERVFNQRVDIEAFFANPTIEGICASLWDAAREKPALASTHWPTSRTEQRVPTKSLPTAYRPCVTPSPRRCCHWCS